MPSPSASSPMTPAPAAVAVPDRTAPARRIGAALAGGARQAAAFAHDLVAVAVRLYARRALRARLDRLSDRLLADIGLERTTLDSAVDRVLPRQPVPFFDTTVPRLAGRLGGARAARRRRAALARELGLLDDRALADFGITRRDIPAVAAANEDHPVPRAA